MKGLYVTLFLLCLFAFSAVAQEVTLPEPVSFFDFEETEGAVVTDQGTAGNNGEIVGAWIDRVEGDGIITKPDETPHAIEFIEENAFGELTYVLVPYQEYMNSPNYTLSTWMKYSGDANWGYLFWADGETYEPEIVDRHIDVWLHPYDGALGVDCILHLQDEGQLRVANVPDDTGINLADGDWHQVTVVLKENIEYAVYIDGVWAADDGGAATDLVVENNGDDLYLGARPNDANFETSVKLVGLMDRVRIWDQALTEEQIEYLFLMEGPEGGTVDVAEKIEAPTEFALKANYPNPFNPTTTISYSLDKTEQVTLEVYDLLGHKISTLVSGVQASGEHQVQWNGTDDLGQTVSSGVYLYRLTSGQRVETRKMMLLQ